MGFCAIFGGTFNPFHIGHYEMLLALEKCNFVEKVLLLPDKIPPHKVCDYMPDEKHRIEMCRIIAESFSKANLCLLEFEREGKSYSYDTVMLLKEKFPHKKFALVCGGDMLVTFDKWYKYELLLKEVSLIVFKRADIPENEFNAKIVNLKKLGAKIFVIDEEITAVSSTKIRIDFEKHKDLLPKEIYDYIKREEIY